MKSLRFARTIDLVSRHSRTEIMARIGEIAVKSSGEALFEGGMLNKNEFELKQLFDYGDRNSIRPVVSGRVFQSRKGYSVIRLRCELEGKTKALFQFVLFINSLVLLFIGYSMFKETIFTKPILDHKFQYLLVGDPLGVGFIYAMMHVSYKYKLNAVIEVLKDRLDSRVVKPSPPTKGRVMK